MTLLPWRVRNFLSENFPLLYHLVINIGNAGNSPEHWDRRLAKTWNDPQRSWPILNKMIASATTLEDRILDIGCGNGSMLRYLRGLGYKDLSGLDISRYSINQLRAEGIEMHFGRLPMVPLPDNDFDVVIASAVLEHVIRRRTFIKEIRRILRPGGRVIIVVPDNCLGPIDEPEHCMKYTDSSLRRFLEKNFESLTIEHTRDIYDTSPLLFSIAQKSSR